MPRWWIAPLAVVLLTAFAAGRRAEPVSAIPIFAHQYGVTCAKCHSVIPHLNEFGAAFMASGYRIPGVKPGPAFPISAKTNLVASSANQGDGPNGAGLPKDIVDEIEVFTSGGIGSRASYLVEQYVVDGGMPGLTRDAWVNDRINPWNAKIPVYGQAGSFTLPLPVDPETFRDSYQGYALFTQTVGANPFTFFDPKIGARLGIGDPLRGLNLQLFAGPGHDRQSGLPSAGTDAMAYAQDAMGPLTLSSYRYQGTRPVPLGPNDWFQRTGFGLVYNDWRKWSSETVLQTGWDTNCGVTTAGRPCSSTGGLEQLRYSINKKYYALARYEGIANSTGVFQRDAVLMLGYGPSENSRLTVEDVIQHVPYTTNTLNVQFSVGY